MPKQFVVKNLQDLENGKVALAINKALQRCVEDVKDRPNEKKARKVLAQFELTPKLEKDSGVLEEVEVVIHVRERVPDRRSRIYPMVPASDGMLLFEPTSPDNPRQGGLPYREQEPAETVDADIDEDADE
jgi:hypothetical protein